MARSPENFFDTRIGAQFNKSASNARMVVPSGQFGTLPVLNNSATFSAYASSSRVHWPNRRFTSCGCG